MHMKWREIGRRREEENSRRIERGGSLMYSSIAQVGE